MILLILMMSSCSSKPHSISADSDEVFFEDLEDAYDVNDIILSNRKIGKKLKRSKKDSALRKRMKNRALRIAAKTKSLE